MGAKNKKILIASGFILVIIVGIAISFSAYRIGTKTESKSAECDTIISEVLSKSSSDPLYEPPKTYFDCIDRS